ncbi:hypothetical protein O1611_g8794 [Lasiodiplodia mahajangana]|uniref:Uncharacterized protein n=1 Tax=Lasiodiplodia mahajangana TaxID=1108764 RepID=A0ACC2JBL9_9PEZI|nr:hypothetical protein O1611_g8794 [Lasiodiplodia mahajangana]
MSSYTTSLEARPTPFATDGGEDDDDDDEDTARLFVRSQDKVWYNPSLDQMVETLQTLLMTHGVLEPIPIEYNSYVLHLVDGFAKARENTRKAEAACQEARQSLEHNLDEFRQLANDWLERESQYRSEVKRLEVLLSKSSQGGLEVVTLARTNSIVDRSGFRDGGLISRLSKFRKHPTNDSVSPSTPFPATDQVSRTQARSIQAEDGGSARKDNDNDFRMSEKIRRQDAVTKASATRDRRGYRRGEIPRPELGGLRDWHDRFRNPFAGTLTTSGIADGRHDPHKGAPLPTGKHVRDGISVGLLSPKTSHCQADTLGIPAVSTFDPLAGTDGTSMMQVVPRHDQGGSGIPLEPTSYFDPLLDNPARARRDSSCERQTTMASSPSQSIYGCDSPTAISTTTQDSPQRRQARMNARIAAELALDDIKEDTSQKI